MSERWLWPAEVVCERLCRHHSIEGFRCGEEFFDEGLKQYMEHVDDPIDPVVFAAVNGKQVVGYFAIRDLMVKSIGTGERRLYLALPALAIHLEYQGRNLLALFYETIVTAVRLREQGPRHYSGLAIHPHTSSIYRFLRRHRFRPVADDEFWWVGPFLRPA